MNYLHQNCPYAYPERDENYTLDMCRLHPEKLYGVGEKDCMDCPECPDKDWQAWKHSLHETKGESYMIERNPQHYTFENMGESMTTAEWRVHTDDWRRGWRDCQEAKDVDPNPSEEYLNGYRYGLEHPFGPVAVPM